MNSDAAHDPKPSRQSASIATRWSLVERLKNWDDRASWEAFHDTYRGLILGVARRSGLSESEAQDVMQETLLAVAKKMPEFVADGKRGSFKSWLLTNVRWRITDQARKKLPGFIEAAPLPGDERATAFIDRVPGRAHEDIEGAWELEWQRHVAGLAEQSVRQKVSTLEWQIFDLVSLRKVSAKQVGKTLGLALWKVYLYQTKVTSLLRREVKRANDDLGGGK